MVWQVQIAIMYIFLTFFSLSTSDVVCMNLRLTDGRYYIELTMAVNTPSPPVDIPKKRPEVRCDSETTAQTV